MAPIAIQNEKKRGEKMTEVNNLNSDLHWVIGFVACFFLVVIIISLVSFFDTFVQELKYMNIEIRRTSGAERKRWIRQRRRLWLSLIPFVKY
jgi:hypothetical protein